MAPGAQDLAARRNDESLVMKLVYGKHRLCWKGDAEKRSEQQIAEEQPEADLLKVAPSRQRDFHHPPAARPGASLDSQ